MTSSPAAKADLNLEIRRNYYDQSGKDLTATAKGKEANGEESTGNDAATGNSTTKAIEDIAKEPKKAFYCYSCGVDCTRVRFHFAKSPPATAGAAAAKTKYDLCPNCFVDGRWPSSHDAHDFVKFEDPGYTSVPDRDAPWTDAELLLLLEGLELFDENWNSISDHVGTRTREECVLKFLQLEIEDKYLEDGANANSTTGYGALNYGRIPFAQSDNPVMSVLSFLASMAEPSVAAAAANRSVEEMRRVMRKRLENGAEASSPEPVSDKDKGKAKEALKDEGGEPNPDAMDVTEDPATNIGKSPQPDAENQISTIPSSKNENDNEKPAAEDIATVALATSAARAGALSTHEERNMSRLISTAVNLTLQKFELKLAQFSELESVLQAERRELERGRQELFLERLAFRKRVRGIEEGLRKAKIRGGEEGARLAEEVVGAVGPGGKLDKLGFAAGNGETTKPEEIQPLSVVGNGDYRSYEM